MVRSCLRVNGGPGREFYCMAPQGLEKAILQRFFRVVFENLSVFLNSIFFGRGLNLNLNFGMLNSSTSYI